MFRGEAREQSVTLVFDFLFIYFVAGRQRRYLLVMSRAGTRDSFSRCLIFIESKPLTVFRMQRLFLKSIQSAHTLYKSVTPEIGGFSLFAVLLFPHFMI